MDGPSAAYVPLCVDLDGTLVRTDTLAETLIRLLARNPLYVFLLPFWLSQGRAFLKAEVARRSIIEPDLLPYNRELLEYLREQRAEGRSLYLVTAANQRTAEAVAVHTALFDGILASDERSNLKGNQKAALLIQQFGAKGFDYVGDSSADLPAWRAARLAFLARPGSGLEARLTREGVTPARVFERRASAVRTVAPLLRVHQWLKNVLVFVPLVASHSLDRPGLVLSSTIAFVAFSLAASSVYIVNDLVDLYADRRHPRKRERPFASGEVSLWVGVLLAPLLIVASGLLTLTLLPWNVLPVLLFYLITTTLYSLWLKRVVLVDVVTLAGLYTLRVIAGAAAIATPLSFWLLAFSMFMFLSLALIKRFTEMKEALHEGLEWVAGRGYRSSDLHLLMSLGTGAGHAAVLVLALYIHSPDVLPLYSRPEFLWVLCPLLLYWTARVWMQAERSNMHDDPLVFAVKDWVTRVVVALGGIALWVAN